MSNIAIMVLLHHETVRSVDIKYTLSRYVKFNINVLMKSVSCGCGLMGQYYESLSVVLSRISIIG